MPFSSLPVEVLQNILHQTPDLTSLNSLALTNRNTYRAFIARRTEITTDVLERFLAKGKKEDLESTLLKVPSLYVVYKELEKLIISSLFFQYLEHSFLEDCSKFLLENGSAISPQWWRCGSFILFFRCVKAAPAMMHKVKQEFSKVDRLMSDREYSYMLEAFLLFQTRFECQLGRELPEKSSSILSGKLGNIWLREGLWRDLPFDVILIKWPFWVREWEEFELHEYKHGCAMLVANNFESHGLPNLDRQALEFIERVWKGTIKQGYGMRNDSCRAGILIFGLALADRYAVSGRASEAIALGNELWDYEKKYGAHAYGGQTSLFFDIAMKVASYYISNGNLMEAVAILEEAHSQVSPKHQAFCAWSVLTVDTLVAMDLVDDADDFHEMVTMKLDECSIDDLALEEKADRWQEIGSPGGSASGDKYRYEFSPMYHMQRFVRDKEQGRSLQMSNLQWRSIPLPILGSEPRTKKQWSALVARYGRPGDAAFRNRLYHRHHFYLENGIDEDIDFEDQGFKEFLKFKDSPDCLRMFLLIEKNVEARWEQLRLDSEIERVRNLSTRDS